MEHGAPVMYRAHLADVGGNSAQTGDNAERASAMLFA